MPGTFVSPFRWPQVLMEPERNVAPVLRQPSAVAQTYPGLLQVESELINGHYLWHPFRQGPVAVQRSASVAGKCATRAAEHFSALRV